MRRSPLVKNELEGDAVEFNIDGQIKSKIHYKRDSEKGPASPFLTIPGRRMIEDYTDGLLRKGTYYNQQVN